MILRFLLPSRRTLAAAVVAALLGAGTLPGAPDGPSRPGAGPRPRKSSPSVPAPPPPPPSEWTTQAGPRTGTNARAEPAPGPAEPAAAAEPETPPPPDPLFDDRPTGSFEPITWTHAPSGYVVSTETYTEEACTRLLADDTLPGTARAALLGGRARARTRMWRLDAARTDIEAALALDPRSAPLRLVHAELLACFGQTDEADSVLQEAFALDPESTLSARALGLIRFQQGSMQSAADALATHLTYAANTGTAAGDATLPLLRAVAADDLGSLDATAGPDVLWTAQLTAFLAGRIDRATLLDRARTPRDVTPDEAACTAWFYLGQRNLARRDRERASLDLLAALRTGCTAIPEYRLAAADLIRLRTIRADSLPGRLAQ